MHYYLAKNILIKFLGKNKLRFYFHIETKKLHTLRIQFTSYAIKKFNFSFLYPLLVILLFSHSLICYTQSQKIDSLVKIYNHSKSDTSRIKIQNSIAWELSYSNLDSAIALAKKTLLLSKKLKWTTGIANSLGDLGTYYYYQGDYIKSINHNLKALKIEENRKDLKGMSARLGNLGLVYYEQKQYGTALKFYSRALEIAEKLHDKIKITAINGNLGNVYADLKEYNTANMHYEKSLKLANELGDKNRQAIQLGNIGVVYQEQLNYEKALEYEEKALKLSEESGYEQGVAIWTGNIGIMCVELLNTKSKKEFHQLSQKAERYLLKALALNKKIGARRKEMDVQTYLSSLYKHTGDYKKSLFHLKNSRELKDTLFNDDKRNEITKKELNYQFEKKEALAKTKHPIKLKKQKAINEEKSRQAKIVLICIIIGLALLSIIAASIFRILYKTRKQKTELSNQKELIETKQKEIIDSIHYAKRIQHALLPSEKYVSGILNKNYLVLLILFTFSYNTNSFGQNKIIDSLKLLLKTAKDDTIKVNALDYLAFELYPTNPDSTIIVGLQAAKLAKKLNYIKGQSNAYGTVGVGYWMKGDYPKALDNYFTALKIDEKSRNKEGIATRLGNIGLIYKAQNDFENSLKYFNKALKMSYDRNDSTAISRNLGNIGTIYIQLNDETKSLEYFSSALKIAKKINNLNHIGSWLENIGVIYFNLALKNSNLIERKIQFDSALTNFSKSLIIAEELNNNDLLTETLTAIGEVYIETKRYSDAETYLLKALEVTKTLGALQSEMYIETSLSKLYEKKLNFKAALEHYNRSMVINDSLFNEDKSTEITKREMSYEFEKKEAVAKAKQKGEIDQQNAVAFEKDQQQRTIAIFSTCCIFVVILFLIFIIRSLRITRKQKLEIELQKTMVEEKQREIIDSIYYARRIQNALLPSEKYFQKSLARKN